MASLSQTTIWINLLIIFFCSQVIEASHIVHSEAEIGKISPLTNTNVEGSIQKNQPYRTAYHFQPIKNWMNDPNGPMEYKGVYHLFYQYNPKGAVWGNIVWGHSVSTDLINWRKLPFALLPDQKYDREGVWSGSATILPDGRPAMLYTGVDEEKKQVQALAFPKDLSDRWLREWIKVPQNPLIVPDSKNNINASSFRDPTTAWIGEDGSWRMIVGSKNHQRGLALLFKSKDFIKWTMVDHPLYYVDGNGMWECLDFYPVHENSIEGIDTSSPNIDNEDKNMKYVFKISVDDTRKDYYTIGTYDKAKDLYIPDEGSIEDDSGLRYDYGKFYASKSFYDSVKKRRILWAWINESSSWEYDVKKGWHGLMNVPRAVWLHESGDKLAQWPVEEVNKLRTSPIILYDVTLKKGTDKIIGAGAITASQADVEVTFTIATNALEKAEVIRPGQRAQHLCGTKGVAVDGVLGPFGMKVLASPDMNEFTAVFFRIFKSQNKYVVLMCSDQSRSSVNEDNDMEAYGAFVDVDPIYENLNLRILIDHSIVESFGNNGTTVMTARVHPTKAIGNRARLFVFNGGEENVMVSKLSAWSMKEAKIA